MDICAFGSQKKMNLSTRGLNTERSEFRLGQSLPNLVFGREFRLQTWWPGDADARVVPGNAALVLGGVVIGGFVQKICTA